MDKTVMSTTQVTQPIIIDLGRQKAKDLKEFKKGEGKLWEDVQAVVGKVQDELGETAAGKVVIPVVMIFEKKQKRPRLDRLFFPNL
jgi:hypothetical protein